MEFVLSGSCAKKASATLPIAGSVASISMTRFLIIRHSRLIAAAAFATTTSSGRSSRQWLGRAWTWASSRARGFGVDASVIEADASRYHGKAPDEIDWSLLERQTRAVAADYSRPGTGPDRVRYSWPGPFAFLYD